MVHKINGFPDREIIVDNKRFLYFGGTAYLGLQTDPEFQDIFIKNIKKFGTNYGASRNANVHLPIYEEVESYLANLVGSESCITLSSGYLTGQMIAKYFHFKNHQCFYAPDAHEALHLLGTKNYERQNDLIGDLNTSIKNGKNPVLFLDSISLDGKNHPDFNWLKELPINEITLVVDDSHGFGIVGENGGGVFKQLKKMKPKELVVCGSLGKGFGIQAGFLAGGRHTIKELKSSDMFAAASPAGAAFMATMLQSQDILSEKRRLLFEHIDYFTSNLSDKEYFDFIPGYPCFSFENDALANHLLENDIVITNFYYPTEKDNLVQRVVLSAHHKKGDVQKLIETINKFLSS